jgi:hypothetical protein
MKLVEMVWIMMANHKFSAAEREAIWLAHEKKCPYTRELIDVSSSFLKPLFRRVVLFPFS